MPGPVMRIAPKPSLATDRSSPIRNMPDCDATRAALVVLVVMSAPVKFQNHRLSSTTGCEPNQAERVLETVRTAETAGAIARTKPGFLTHCRPQFAARNDKAAATVAVRGAILLIKDSRRRVTPRASGDFHAHVAAIAQHGADIGASGRVRGR